MFLLVETRRYSYMVYIITNIFIRNVYIPTEFQIEQKKHTILSLIPFGSNRQHLQHHITKLQGMYK